MNPLRFKSILLGLLLAGFLVLGVCPSAWTQGVNTASLSGRIADSSGAAVPGAMVSVTSEETGVSRTTASDSAGEYRVLQLQVSRYDVKVEKTGFRTAVQTGIDLVVGQEGVVNLVLSVGEVQQQVTVSEEAPVVNTTTESIGGVVSEKTVKDLPLNGRSFDQLIALNAGAANTTSMVRGVQVGSGGVGAQVGNYFSVSGRGWGENLFLLNGVEYPGPSQNHSEPGGVSGELLGVEAVREFNVETDTYGAQYGKRAGAQISIVTQSGTNQLHGTLFEFLRNSDLDARNAFDFPLGERIPPYKRNQFGAAAGGPIQKDKTFIFGNYEGFRERLGVSNVSIDPDNNARQGLLPCGTITPLPANCPSASSTMPMQVPGEQAGMLAILDAYYPAPNGPELGGGTAEAFYNPLQSIREDFGTMRVDHTFSDKDTLNGSYLVDDGYSKTPIVDPLWAQVFAIRAQVLSLQEIHIFSPNLINAFTVGFSRTGFQFISEPFNPIPTSDYFVTGPSPGQIRISAGGITAGGGLTATDQTYARNLFTYQDLLQVIKGRHQLSFGVTVTPLASNELGPVAQGGSVTFSSLMTMLQGTAQLFNVTPVQTHLYWRQIEGAWYAQDTIQMARNLTVRLGLRQEFTNGWNEAHDNAYTYAFSSNTVYGQPVLLTTPVGPTGSIYAQNNSQWLFGPRAGLAWDPFGKGKNSIRAGFGIYYDTVDTLGLAFADRIPPTNGSVAFSNAAFLPLIPVNPSTPVAPPCGPGVPGSINPITGVKTVGTCTIFSPNGIDPNLKIPLVEEWNLTFEQQITPNTSLSLAYVGSRGYHNMLAADPNQIPSVICSNPAGCLAGGNNASTQQSTVAPGTLYVPVATTLLNPYLSTSSAYLYDIDTSTYNALNVQLVRRFSGGLQFKAAYTWSKDLDYSADTTNIGTILDTSDPKLSWGPATDEALPQKFVFSGGYALPIGRGKHWMSSVNGVANKLVSGWQLNTILSVQSGQCFSPAESSNRTGNGETGGGPPSYNPAFSGPIITGTTSQWFNPNAFMLQPFGTYGSVQRCAFQGPNFFNVDVSAFKTTAVTERISAQFRAEAFNVFNRPNYGLPNATLGSSAGLITTAGTSRQIQFGLKLIF